LAKNVLITGASGAIGAACARYFAQNGYFVYAHYNGNEQKIRELVGEIGEGSCQAIKFDVSDSASVSSALEGIEVDVIVNNAGITRDKLFFWMENDDWESVIKTNVNGAFYVCKILLPSMIKKKNGAVVNISSITGLVGNIGQANYAASKGALISFTKSLSLEVARYNIRVNCVAPGLVKSAMTEGLDEAELKKLIPLKRFAEPREIAEVVFFVADKASYMTGETINVSGGMVR
jgi:3-oxoacyl-[acyl-carrier protein] reductase